MWYWASLAPTVSVVGSTTYVYKYFILSKSLKSQAEQARAIARPCSARRFLTYCFLVPLNHHSRFNHHLYKIQINHHFFTQKSSFWGFFEQKLEKFQSHFNKPPPQNLDFFISRRRLLDADMVYTYYQSPRNIKPRCFGDF